MSKTDMIEIDVSMEDGICALDIADDLIVRADHILYRLGGGNPGSGAPAELTIDGGIATLKWNEFEPGYYDDPGSMRESEGSFPAAVLFMVVADASKWIDDERARRASKAAEQQRKRAAEYGAVSERHEREQLAVLKAKYEKD